MASIRKRGNSYLLVVSLQKVPPFPHKKAVQPDFYPPLGMR